MTTQSGPVVAAVNGSSLDESTLRAAVVEARRLGVGLRLVHVVPDYVSISPLMPIAPADLESVGSEVLRSAEKVLHQVAPAIVADSMLMHGSRSRRLAEAASDAPALVVGRDDRSLPVRLLRGNAATGAAAAAGCPVIAVPAGWRPTPARGAVVVGVKSATHASELLGDAFALADALGATLVVLHAWKLPSGYDDLIESRVAADEFAQHSIGELEALMKDWRDTYPSVDVEIRVVHDRAVTALTEASRDADVLVVVRRAHGVPSGVQLGGTVRAVLRSAYCPVRVVPASTTLDAMPGLVLEEAGTVAK